MPIEIRPCACLSAPRLVFACSGAADVGEISDRVARSLHRQGVGKMFCLAGIGGRVSGILKSTEAAASILALDGCPLDCAKRTLEEAGLHDFQHLRVTDWGVKKGEASITDELLADMTARCAGLLASVPAPGSKEST